MKKNKRKKNVTWHPQNHTTGSLLEKVIEEKKWEARKWANGKCYYLSLKLENGPDVNVFIEVLDKISFIRLMDFRWHEVKMTNVEEVARVKSAINQFNSESRAKVYYRVEDGRMTLSTILYCSFCKEIPDITSYFHYQMQTVFDAHEFIFPSDEEFQLPFWNMGLPPQLKPIKDIVLDTLKELNCKPDVEPYNDHCDSIAFNFQTEPFDIRVIPTNGFILLLGPAWYSFDATDVDKLSVVKSIVNELNWDSKVNVVYWIDNGVCEVGFRVFLTCMEGMNFTQSLYMMLFNYFHSRNMFHKMLAESSAR